MRSLFGTDGIRGPAGQFPLDLETVSRIGFALVRSMAATGGPQAPSILLGCDTRESSLPTVAALVAGIEAAGGSATFAGVVPTPAVAYLVSHARADAGISVSASHNPWQDNGIKIFARTGRKLPDAVEMEIEREIDISPASAARRAPEVDPTLAERYVSHLVSSLPVRLDGLSVVLDTAHGAAFEVAPEAFRRAGARVHTLASSPDGRNINSGCGALHPEGLARAVVEMGADLGLALDGDADRAVLADSKGELHDGDDVLYLWVCEQAAEGRPPGVLVGTVMTNFGLERALDELGVRLVRSPVGDRYVAEEMERTGALLGGEPSGHLIRADLATTGDGTLTGLLVAAGVVSAGRPLAAQPRFPRTPQVLRNVRVRERLPFDLLPGFPELLAHAERRLGRSGRILVRYSGTEPLARVMVEGTDAALVEGLASELAGALRAASGAV